nr:MAG TPA: hypothetical protein [Caudoviricetes sp.]
MQRVHTKRRMQKRSDKMWMCDVAQNELIGKIKHPDIQDILKSN